MIQYLRYTQEFLYRGRYIKRVQFPPAPCWVCTVHKTQGLSLSNAVISLGPSIFQAGQAYVALSRLRSLSGLYIKDIRTSKIYCDTKVIEEYNKLLHEHSSNCTQCKYTNNTTYST